MNPVGDRLCRSNEVTASLHAPEPIIVPWPALLLLTAAAPKSPQKSNLLLLLSVNLCVTFDRGVLRLDSPIPGLAPRLRPPHGIFCDEVMSSAGEGPVSNRGRERNRLTVEGQNPTVGVQVCYHLASASTATIMSGESKTYRNVDYAFVKRLRQPLDEQVGKFLHW